MPSYLPKDASGVSLAPFPGRDGRPEIDWLLIEEPFGRMLTSEERDEINQILLTYSIRMADDFNAPPIRDVLRILADIENSIDEPVALGKLLRDSTDDAVLRHVRWELFDAPSAPRDLSPEWLLVLRSKRQQLQDRQDLREYCRLKPAPIWVEGPGGVAREVRIQPETGLREVAFKGLVEDMAKFWERSGTAVRVRKDAQKSLNFTPSAFVRALEALLQNLPLEYRRQSSDALSTATSIILRDRLPSVLAAAKKQNPTSGT